MGLSAREKKMLEDLTRKAEEPDKAPVSRSLQARIDLSDPKQVALAIRHGFLDADELEDEEGGEGDDEGDETPKRRGYFPTDGK